MNTNTLITVLILSILSTPVFAMETKMDEIEESACVVLNSPYHYSKTSLIKKSVRTGEAVQREMKYMLKDQPDVVQAFQDIFGNVRGYQFSNSIYSKSVMEDPNDKECSRYHTAAIVRQCSIGEDQNGGYCRTICQQFSGAPDCR